MLNAGKVPGDIDINFRTDQPPGGGNGCQIILDIMQTGDPDLIHVEQSVNSGPVIHDECPVCVQTGSAVHFRSPGEEQAFAPDILLERAADLIVCAEDRL